jgi:hypothetical protein
MTPHPTSPAAGRARGGADDTRGPGLAPTIDENGDRCPKCGDLWVLHWPLKTGRVVCPLKRKPS